MTKIKIGKEMVDPHAKRVAEVECDVFSKGIEFVKKNKCDGLRVLTSSTGDSQRVTLDFSLFEETQNLRALSIGTFVELSKRQDLQGLYFLKKLESLGFHGKDAAIDFSRLFSLESLTYTFSKKATGFEYLVNLKNFRVWSLNTDDCAIISRMIKLEELHISPSQLGSLRGIEKLKNLNTVKIARCPKLQDIEPLAQLKALRKLWVEACANVTDYSPLVGHTAIESLTLDVVESLSFLPSLKNLTQIYFNKLIDGNLSPVLHAPKLLSVRFLDKKHYSHTKKEIEALIKSRVTE
jgi:hypothetical protein